MIALVDAAQLWVETMQGADKTLTLTAAVVRATRLGRVLGCCIGA